MALNIIPKGEHFGSFSIYTIIRTWPKKSAYGFTLIEIVIVIAIIGAVISMSVPGMLRARAESRLTVCCENLRTIAAAVELCKTRHPELLMRKGGKDVLIVLDDDCCLVKLGYLKSIPKCPNGGEYSYKFSKAQHGQAYPGYWHISHQTEGHHTDAGLTSWFPYYRSDTGITLYDRNH